MLSTWREDSLLGSYQERDYSKGFQVMMSKVVEKIYRNKKSKQKVLETMALPPYRDHLPKRQSKKISYSEEVNRHRKSSPFSSFYSVAPSQKVNGLRDQNSNKYSLPSFKATEECNKTVSQSNKRLHSLQPTLHSETLYRKISQYNACLITKTFKFQDKDRFAVSLDDNQQKESPFNQQSGIVSRIKKCEDFRRNNRWIHSKGKFINRRQGRTEGKEDFMPWQIDHCQQLQY